MREPIAVLISDIHFTVPTLEAASSAFLQAQFKAKLLDVPLVVAGDTLDTKAVIRAECANALIDLLSVTDGPPVIFLVGNHDKVNEKGSAHSLNFIKKYATVIETPRVGHLKNTEVMLIPYQAEPELIDVVLHDEDFPAPRIVIMHQGVRGSASGSYFADKTAIDANILAGFRVISGHYHTRQSFDLPDGGTFDYIGNPYTLSFGEADDPVKGYQILYDDGSLEFVPTNLRRHRILEIDLYFEGRAKINKNDIVWVKVRGSKLDLSKISKEYVANKLQLELNFRLEFIPTDEEFRYSIDNHSKHKQFDEFLDNVSNIDKERKERLKSIWNTLSK